MRNFSISILCALFIMILSAKEVLAQETTVYKIQIAALSKAKQSLDEYQSLYDYGEVHIEKTDKGVQKVVLGYYPSRNLAVAALNKVRAIGYPDAFIGSHIITGNNPYSVPGTFYDREINAGKFPTATTTPANSYSSSSVTSSTPAVSSTTTTTGIVTGSSVSSPAVTQPASTTSTTTLPSVSETKPQRTVIAKSSPATGSKTPTTTITNTAPPVTTMASSTSSSSAFSEATNNPNDELFFVQLGAFNKLDEVPNLGPLSKVGEVMLIQESNGKKLLLGHYMSYTIAQSALKKAKSYGYSDAFIKRITGAQFAAASGKVQPNMTTATTTNSSNTVSPAESAPSTYYGAATTSQPPVSSNSTTYTAPSTVDTYSSTTVTQPAASATEQVTLPKPEAVYTPNPNSQPRYYTSPEATTTGTSTFASPNQSPDPSVSAAAGSDTYALPPATYTQPGPEYVSPTTPTTTTAPSSPVTYTKNPATDYPSLDRLFNKESFEILTINVYDPTNNGNMDAESAKNEQLKGSLIPPNLNYLFAENGEVDASLSHYALNKFKIDDQFDGYIIRAGKGMYNSQNTISLHLYDKKTQSFVSKEELSSIEGGGAGYKKTATIINDMDNDKVPDLLTYYVEESKQGSGKSAKNTEVNAKVWRGGKYINAKIQNKNQIKERLGLVM